MSHPKGAYSMTGQDRTQRQDGQEPDIPTTEAGEDAGLQADIFGTLHPFIVKAKFGQVVQGDLFTYQREQGQ